MITRYRLIAAVVAAIGLTTLSGCSISAESRIARDEVQRAVDGAASAFGAIAETSSEDELREDVRDVQVGITSVVGSSTGSLDSQGFQSGQALVFEVGVDALKVSVIAVGYGGTQGFGGMNAFAHSCASLEATPGSSDVRVTTISCPEPVQSGIAVHWGEAVDAI